MKILIGLLIQVIAYEMGNNHINDQLTFIQDWSNEQSEWAIGNIYRQCMEIDIKGPRPNKDHWLYLLAADDRLNKDLPDNKKYPDLTTCPYYT